MNGGLDRCHLSVSCVSVAFKRCSFISLICLVHRPVLEDGTYNER